MASFTHVASYAGAAYMQLRSIVDMQFFDIAGVRYLAVGALGTNSLSTFRLDPGGNLTLVATLGPDATRGTWGIAELAVLTHNGTTAIIPAGILDDNLGYNTLTGTGSFGSSASPLPPGAQNGYFTNITSLTVGGKTILIGAQDGINAIRSFVMTSATSAAVAATFTDSDQVHLGTITDLLAVYAHGKAFLLAASGSEHGISVFEVNSAGSFTLLGAYGTGDGLWINTPNVLESLTFGGETLVFVGALGSDSLTVLALNADGSIEVLDHVIDSLLTRFESVQAMDSFTVNGRGFLIVGGNDGGITLWEVLPDGRLHHVSTLIDTLDTQLSGIGSIEVSVSGGEIRVFVGSNRDQGISQFLLDLGRLGQVLIGGEGSDILAGGADGDLLSGGGDRDVIIGGAGDDLILDGSSKDILTGGEGADTFILDFDGAADLVLDFDFSEDRLDLSDWPMLYDAAALTFTPTTWGVIISHHSEAIYLRSADLAPLYENDFTSENFIFA